MLCERHAYCQHHFIAYRHHLYKELPQRETEYRQIVTQIQTAELKLREEALSFALYRLRVSYTVFKRSLEHYLDSDKSQVVGLWASMFSPDPAEFEGVCFDRETVIDTAKRLAQVANQTSQEFPKGDEQAL